MDQRQSSQDSPSSSRPEEFGVITAARGIFLLLSFLCEMGTEKCAEFFANPLIPPGILPESGKQSDGNTIHQWSFRKLPCASSASPQSKLCPLGSLCHCRDTGTAKRTWAHEKAAETKLAKGHLRSLPAPSGSSTQIETLEAASGWLARTQGSPSVLSVQCERLREQRRSEQSGTDGMTTFRRA